MAIPTRIRCTTEGVAQPKAMELQLQLQPEAEECGPRVMTRARSASAGTVGCSAAARKPNMMRRRNSEMLMATLEGLQSQLAGMQSDIVEVGTPSPRSGTDDADGQFSGSPRQSGRGRWQVLQAATLDTVSESGSKTAKSSIAEVQRQQLRERREKRQQQQQQQQQHHILQQHAQVVEEEGEEEEEEQEAEEPDDDEEEEEEEEKEEEDEEEEENDEEEEEEKEEMTAVTAAAVATVAVISAAACAGTEEQEESPNEQNHPHGKDEGSEKKGDTTDQDDCAADSKLHRRKGHCSRVYRVLARRLVVRGPGVTEASLGGGGGNLLQTLPPTLTGVSIVHGECVSSIGSIAHSDRVLQLYIAPEWLTAWWECLKGRRWARRSLGSCTGEPTGSSCPASHRLNPGGICTAAL